MTANGSVNEASQSQVLCDASLYFDVPHFVYLADRGVAHLVIIRVVLKSAK